MKTIRFIGAIITTVCIVFFLSNCVKSTAVKTMAPLPSSESGLPTIIAEPWVKIDNDPNIFLEGPAFDREGNLFVTSVSDGRIFKITSEGKISTIFNKKGVLADGIAIHKDGRLFVACISGELMTMDTNGGNITNVEPKYQGKPKSLNDLVFDAKGNLYVTDFTGTFANPIGGVYRFAADGKTVQPVIENLASANGIAFSPEGNVLWVTETGRNALIRLQLAPDGIAVRSAGIPYRFTGTPGCDSMKVDAKGNVYVGLVRQGRALILNSQGIPVANVLVPGRDEGKNLGTANLAFKPGTNEVFITAFGTDGAWIYKFRGLAEGLKLFSHQ
jgi:lactonase